MASAVSLCTVRIGNQRFGIATEDLHEVLGSISIQPVPLVPSFVAGIGSYRGEVLTIVQIGALLGFEACTSTDVLVLSDRHKELYGLCVDSIEEVFLVDPASSQSPPISDGRLANLTKACYRDASGLVIQLDAEELTPSRLLELQLRPEARAETKEIA